MGVSLWVRELRAVLPSQFALLLLCPLLLTRAVEDGFHGVLRRLKAHTSDHAVVGVPATPGRAVSLGAAVAPGPKAFTFPFSYQPEVKRESD